MKKLFFCAAILLASVHVSAADPCSKFQTDASRIVAHGTGFARHLDTARIKAQMDANVKLEKDIVEWIKLLTDLYIVDSNLDPDVYRPVFDLISQQKAEEQTDHASVICNKKGSEKDGMLCVYIALEVERKTVLDSFRNAFREDKKLNEVYDDNKFLTLYRADLKRWKK